MSITVSGRPHANPMAPFRVQVFKNGNTTEYARLSTTGLLRPGNSNFGLNLQTDSNIALNVDITFAKEKDAMNPDPAMQANINWEPVGTVINDTPLVVDTLPTVLRITFPAAVPSASCTIVSL